MKPKGFDYHGKRIMYVEPRGKDPRTDINRWRMSLYYETHYAETHFCYSQQEYDRTLAAWQAVTFSDYNDYRNQPKAVAHAE